jgi:hypothetical protein
MPRCTLREYLSYPNPELNVLPDATSSSRPPSDSWPTIDSWQQWEDFSTANINVLFGVLLDTEFDLADPPVLLEEQRYIRDERSFEFILARWNNIIVNEALRAASEYLFLENVCWIIGSLVLPGEDDAEPIMRPDWAAVTGRILSGPGMRSSLVPGDTKFAKERFMIESPGFSDKKNRPTDDDGFPQSSPMGPDERSKREYLRSCLEQINYYALRHQTRYCYIISNNELLLVRRTADCPTISSQSLARTRGQRQQHARDTTPTPMLPLPTPSSQTLSSPYSQDALSSSPPYSDHDRPNMNMANPDVRSIPWKRNSGLTVNIALFVLHMLAGLSRDVRDGYPDIHEDPEYFTKLRQPSQ